MIWKKGVKIKNSYVFSGKNPALCYRLIKLVEEIHMAAPTGLDSKAVSVSATEDLHLGMQPFTTIQFSLREQPTTCLCFIQQLCWIQLCSSCRQMSEASGSSCCHILWEDHAQLSEKGPDRAPGTNPVLQELNVGFIALALLLSSHVPDHHQLLRLRFFSRNRQAMTKPDNQIFPLPSTPLLYVLQFPGNKWLQQKGVSVSFYLVF